jgi:hypothetical protein
MALAWAPLAAVSIAAMVAVYLASDQVFFGRLRTV